MRQLQFKTFPQPVRDDSRQRLGFTFLIDAHVLRVRLKMFTWLAFVALYCLVGLRGALAQIDQGAITGTITDSQGKIISGASVSLVDQDTGISFQRTTNNDGSYRFAPIKIGLYSLTVTAPGFETKKQEKRFRLHRTNAQFVRVTDFYDS